VVVALAILSVAVVAGIQLFAGGLRLLKLAGEHQEATLIADAKTREVSAFVEGHETGTDGDFTWERTVRRTDVPVELATTTPHPDGGARPLDRLRLPLPHRRRAGARGGPAVRRVP